jgi:hypothetical protein
MQLGIRISAVGVVVVLLGGGSAFAQTTASQTFTVSVPQNVSITAPASPAPLIHDETDSNQSFATQVWSVRGNTANGVTVTFATNQAFTNTTDSTYKRDVRLDLSVNTTQGPGVWTVSVPTDTTNYGSSDEIATVQVASNRVGRSTLNLGVTFITGTYGTFLEGDYTTTVTGTVTVNP